MSHKFLVSNDRLMQRLGAKLSQVCLAQNLAPIIFLQGPLGAGKTTFTRGFLTQRGHQGAVKSPTYTLVEPYDFKEGPVYHFDFYRINKPQECEEMGIRDYLHPGATCLVEWPQQGHQFLPEPHLTVSIVIEEGGARQVTITAHDPDSEQCLEALKKHDD